jgi:hypothetical protein
MPLQQFVYRQLMYLVVVESVLTAIQGSRLHWRPIARRGEIEVKPDPRREADAQLRLHAEHGVVGHRALEDVEARLQAERAVSRGPGARRAWS